MARYGHRVTVALTTEAFYESARDFAATALQAHHETEYRRVTLNAGTALEHLLKACLASRSPALLTEFKDERNFASLLRLLDIPEGRPPGQVRTVSLRAALTRMNTFVTPSVYEDDLLTLVGMRDGTVHAALDDEVEERLMVAFVHHTDALLADLRRDRAEFWGGQLAVVDALLAEAGGKVAHDVAVKLAAARAYFAERYGKELAELVDRIRELEPLGYRGDQVPAGCPACESLGLATGRYDVDWEPDDWDDGQVVGFSGTVWFVPTVFDCRICRLRLDSAAEVEAAGMGRWEIEGADPFQYVPSAGEDSYQDVYRDRY
jgi:HEPN domain